MKIKDNTSYLKTDFNEIPALTELIADQTFEKLQQKGLFIFPNQIDNIDDLTSTQQVLQSNNDKYSTGNVMGFIGYENERLFIESRFITNNNDYFFQYLLKRVLDIPNIVNLSTDSNSDNPLFSILVFLFPSYLKSALRKGLLKKYLNNNYNDENIQGTIDIKRHITKNTPFVGKIAYTKREYSYDNYVIELIRHTIEFIKMKPYGQKILSSIKEEVNTIISATLKYNSCDKSKIISINKKHIIRHSYYREYYTLQKLCLSILQNQKSNLGFGPHQIYGILFDGAWLWEEYINLLLNDMFYHPMNKIKKNVQYLFANGIGDIYPDFISHNETNRIIADAKYKPFSNIKSRDYLQLLAYMFRFDAKKSFYIYPESNQFFSKDNKLNLNKGTSFDKVTKREDIYIIKYGIKIPQTETYNDFVLQMTKQEEELKKYFNNFLDNI